jgi:HAE1 family hydrophobic/amphiphilic exporter-1
MDSVTQRAKRAAKTFTVSLLLIPMTASLPLGVMAKPGEAGQVPAAKSQQAEPGQSQPLATAPAGSQAGPAATAQSQPAQQQSTSAPTAPAAGGSGAAQTQTQTHTGPPQTPAAAPDQSAITKPLAQSPEVGHERVGVNLNQVDSLRLAEAIQLALQNNLDIENFRQSVQIAQYNLFAAKGFYDMVTGSSVSYRSQTSPVSTAISGGGTQGAVTSHILNYNFNDSKQIQQTGGALLLEFDNNRITTSNTLSFLNPTYNPLLQLTYTQPLLRNRKIDASRRNLMILKKQLDQSDSAFRQRVIEIINAVQDAYWELVFAIKNDQIARNAVELARKQLEDNRKMVEAGTLAPIELRSNEAQLEANKGSVISALQTITTDENALKALMLKDPKDKMWSSVIDPVDKPVLGQPAFSVDQATGMALKNRPELEQLKLSQQQADINVQYWKNQTKPQLDFVGIYNNAGQAGTPGAASVQLRGGPPDALTLDIIRHVSRALVAEGLNPFNPAFPPVTSQSLVLDNFNGGYGQALRNLFSLNYQTWQVGVVFSFPWHNHAAEGNLGSTLAQSRQLDAQYRSLVQSIAVQVRNQLQIVDGAWRRYLAAEAGRLAANAQYEGELEKFRAGLSTNFFLLQRQNDLATAEGTKARAEIDYNKALADLQHVTGITLVSNNVQVPPSADTSKPGVTGPSTRVSN